MNRRRFLAAVGAAPLPLAGCLSAPGRTARPSSGSSSGAPRECPPAPGREDVTVHCDGATETARMTASSTELTGSEDSLTVALHNESDAALAATADSFRFYHWHEGDWSLVLEKADTLALRRVEIPPGESRTWRIRQDTASLGPASPPNATHGDRSFVFRFPPGTYSFGFTVRHSGGRSRTDGGSDESSASGDAHRYTQQFEVVGDALALQQSDAVVKTTRRDDTLIVQTRTDREHDHSRRVSLVADRLSSVPDDAAALSRFELYNPGYELVESYDRTFVDAKLTVLLRDAFAHSEGSLSRIRVETVDTTVPPLGLGDDESVPVVYDGTPWRLHAENGWTS